MIWNLHLARTRSNAHNDDGGEYNDDEDNDVHQEDTDLSSGLGWPDPTLTGEIRHTLRISVLLSWRWRILLLYHTSDICQEVKDWNPTWMKIDQNVDETCDHLELIVTKWSKFWSRQVNLVVSIKITPERLHFSPSYLHVKVHPFFSFPKKILTFSFTSWIGACFSFFFFFTKS